MNLTLPQLVWVAVFLSVRFPANNFLSLLDQVAQVTFTELTFHIFSSSTGDVTFTKDLVLVCRHAQCDLHTTTNILATDLASKCSELFKPATAGSPASAKCCASDITLAEFKTLTGKMDVFNLNATTVEEYMMGTPNWRTDWYLSSGAVGTLLTHAESVELFVSLGAKFTPELKSPEVEMPFNGFSQEDYAQKLIDEYRAADIPAEDVWAQSFNLDDVLYWIKNEPRFGLQAVYLDSRYEEGLDPMNPDTYSPSMTELYNMNVRIIAPPIWVLLTTDKNDKIIPSNYAYSAYNAGLNIITWTFERSDAPPTGFYYDSIQSAVKKDGDAYEALDVLAKRVKILGIFSDWPATVTYYANCMGL